MTLNRRAFPSDAIVSMTAAADGWPLRAYDQPARGAARGAILWLGGRGDIFEKYLETFDHWASRGWHVTSFDWRGQGGSGRLGSDRHVGHVEDFAPWIDDLAHFVDAWRTQGPAPHIIMGHSMGGHLVLRALADERIAPDRAVLIAPMLGFDSGPLPFGVATALAGLMTRVGAPERAAWKTNERPAPKSASRQAFLTRDGDRYADEMWWKSHDPTLALGPPSWAWMRAAYRSIAGLRARDAVEGIATPLLFIGTLGDKLVSPTAIKQFATRVPGAKLKMFDRDVAHEILREIDAVRDAALAEIDAFIEAA